MSAVGRHARRRRRPQRTLLQYYNICIVTTRRRHIDDHSLAHMHIRTHAICTPIFAVLANLCRIAAARVCVCVCVPVLSTCYLRHYLRGTFIHLFKQKGNRPKSSEHIHIQRHDRRTTHALSYFCESHTRICNITHSTTRAYSSK